MQQTRDLIIHPGLPKTATTTLQKHIFPLFPGYLGRHYTHHSAHDQSRVLELREAHVRFISDYADPSGATEWKDALSNWVAKMPFDADQLIISDEYLSRWPVKGHPGSFHPGMDVPTSASRTGPHPMIAFLEAVQKSIPSEVRLRIIVSLRNQPDFLASLYAQHAPSMKNPGTEDFEEKIRRLLEVSDISLDYHGIVQGLTGIVGRGDLLILLHEDGLMRNASRIAHFALGSDDILSGVTDRMPPENRRSSGPQTWAARKVGVHQAEDKCHEWWRRTAGRAWPQRMAPSARRRIGETLQRVRSVKAGSEAAATAIVRTDEVLDLIRAHCRDTNVRLARHLDRDLDRLGY
jgi:hypothetical protein